MPFSIGWMLLPSTGVGSSGGRDLPEARRDRQVQLGQASLGGWEPAEVGPDPLPWGDRKYRAHRQVGLGIHPEDLLPATPGEPDGVNPANALSAALGELAATQLVAKECGPAAGAKLDTGAAVLGRWPTACRDRPDRAAPPGAAAVVHRCGGQHPVHRCDP